MRTQPRSLAAATATLLAVLAACSSDSTGPGNSAQFARVITLAEFETTLGAGTARLEISLLPGGLVAREVEIEPDDDEEKIVSRVAAIDDVAGTVTLELGGMTVHYDANTRFRTPQSSRVTRAAWVAAIQAAIAGGNPPPIEARRDPPASPQAPDDASFTAEDLRLSSSFDEPKIEVYVDSDNLQTVASPPPLAILTVFALPIEIDGNTELQARQAGGGVPTGEVEFQGSVTAVDEAGQKFTLSGGTVIRVPGVTFDPQGDVLSLSAMAAAVAGGQAVRAEGHGTVETVGPPASILATSVKVEIDN